MLATFLMGLVAGHQRLITNNRVLLFESGIVGTSCSPDTVALQSSFHLDTNLCPQEFE